MYKVSHAKWAQMIGYLNDLIYVCAPAPLQMGVAKGILELKPEYYNEICDLFSKFFAERDDELEEAARRIAF